MWNEDVRWEQRMRGAHGDVSAGKPDQDSRPSDVLRGSLAPRPCDEKAPHLCGTLSRTPRPPGGHRNTGKPNLRAFYKTLGGVGGGRESETPSETASRRLRSRHNRR